MSRMSGSPLARLLTLPIALVLAGAAAPAGSAPAPQPAPGVSAPAPAAAPQVPSLRVVRQVNGLQLPWDVEPIGPGRFLITERETARLYRYDGTGKHLVRFPSGSVWRSGETGLMSLAVDPRFRVNRRFYTCQGGFTGGGGHDVRVVAWRLDPTGRRAVFQRRLVGGFPTSSGRHGGCRLLILRGGALLVGTGDAAIGSTPQNLRSLGGKTLRLSRWNGAPWPTNPWPNAPSVNRRYVYTYGHRNVQGLAQRADGSLWSVEHGPDRDDEINKLFPGANYGWNPVPGYNESVPMTDFSLPGRQVAARWRSGSPTLATSGATWVRGSRWGGYDGTLAVAALKSSRLLFMRFGPRGFLVWVRAPAAVQQFGRLRSVTNAPNGDLLVTTSNGSGDAVLRVSPR